MQPRYLTEVAAHFLDFYRNISSTIYTCMANTLKIVLAVRYIANRCARVNAYWQYLLRQCTFRH